MSTFQIEVSGVVGSKGTINHDIVVPLGKTLNVRKVNCSGLTANFEANIVWDSGGENRAIFNSDTTTEQTVISELIGDGVKILRLSIHNKKSNESQMIMLRLFYV